jgi:hypothetical protein
LLFSLKRARGDLKFGQKNQTVAAASIDFSVKFVFAAEITGILSNQIAASNGVSSDDTDLADGLSNGTLGGALLSKAVLSSQQD